MQHSTEHLLSFFRRTRGCGHTTQLCHSIVEAMKRKQKVIVVLAYKQNKKDVHNRCLEIMRERWDSRKWYTRFADFWLSNVFVEALALSDIKLNTWFVSIGELDSRLYGKNCPILFDNQAMINIFGIITERIDDLTNVK